MKKNSSKLLTDSEFLFTIIGSMIGISILYVPSTAVSVAKQDGWISTLLGSLYPFYVVLIASIIIKRYPDTNIMQLSRKYLGKIFGNFLNFLFMLQFLYYAATVVNSGVDLLITYAVWFMSPFKVALIFVLLVVYGSCKGLKTLARINILAFFGLSAMMLTTAISFKQGNILNLQPVFETGFDKLAKACIDTSYSYATMELILVIHPHVKNKRNIITLSLISTGIVAFLYTWSVFTAILYMGPDIVPKSFWPFYFVSESVRIPVINNFRFVIMIIWPLILYRTIAIEYYLSASIMNSITGVDYKKWSIFLSPLILFLPLVSKNIVALKNWQNTITPLVTIFNLAYVTLIALIVAVKCKKKRKESECEEV